jgi:hypothetical protein
MSSMRKAPPTSDRGTASAGMTAACQVPRERKITTRTMSTASMMVV